ncbi:hypothetical protein IE077_001909 [Cardiosporidium cionae]|uniref:Uncharacterized protein n=1 Tax=Cardiosporidium cionae TaxID=476202 RepID=A0ABQ7JC12_9APIC|nr:hypothetical protein IE077_001909 [Cardiosporidium cionae]|eukprot:KAF8821552.1 hypothetical protein IE077_001909 [Cardiosporidium cionae]
MLSCCNTLEDVLHHWSHFSEDEEYTPHSDSSSDDEASQCSSAGMGLDENDRAYTASKEYDYGTHNVEQQSCSGDTTLFSSHCTSEESHSPSLLPMETKASSSTKPSATVYSRGLAQQGRNEPTCFQGDPFVKLFLEGELSDMDGENDPDFRDTSDESLSEGELRLPRKNLSKELRLLKKEATYPLEKITISSESARPAKHFSFGEKLTFGLQGAQQLLHDCQLPVPVSTIDALLAQEENHRLHASGRSATHCSLEPPVMSPQHFLLLKIQLDLYIQLLMESIFVCLSLPNDPRGEKSAKSQLYFLRVLLLARHWYINFLRVMEGLPFLPARPIQPSPMGVSCVKCAYPGPLHPTDCILSSEAPRLCLLDIPILRRIEGFFSILENRTTRPCISLKQLKAFFSHLHPFLDDYFQLKVTWMNSPHSQYKYVIFTPAEDRLLGMGLRCYGRSHFHHIQETLLPHKTMIEISKRFRTLQRRWQTHQERLNPLYHWRMNLKHPFSIEEDSLLLSCYCFTTIGEWQCFIQQKSLQRDISSIQRRLKHILRRFRQIKAIQKKSLQMSKIKKNVVAVDFSIESQVGHDEAILIRKGLMDDKSQTYGREHFTRNCGNFLVNRETYRPQSIPLQQYEIPYVENPAEIHQAKCSRFFVSSAKSSAFMHLGVDAAPFSFITARQFSATVEAVNRMLNIFPCNFPNAIADLLVFPTSTLEPLNKAIADLENAVIY